MATLPTNSSLLWRLFGAICLVLLLSIGGNLWQHYLNGDLSKKLYETNNYYRTAQDSMLRNRYVEHRETVIYRLAPISPQVLSELKTGLAAEVRDQLREEFRGQAARLLFAQRTSIITKQVLPTVALKDTVLKKTDNAGIVSYKRAKAGTFKDQWLQLTGVVTDDSLSVKYFVRNDFDIRAYSKRDAKHWRQFWAKRKVFVDLKNQNPNATTQKIDAVVVEKQ